MNADSYPDVLDPNLVGTYSPLAKAGGGYVWDDVLEYRVWCHPERGSPDLEDGSDYYHPFATYAEALAFSQSTEGAEEPLALIRQLEHIAEDNPGEYPNRSRPERYRLNPVLPTESVVVRSIIDAAVRAERSREGVFFVLDRATASRLLP